MMWNCVVIAASILCFECLLEPDEMSDIVPFLFMIL